MKQTSPAAPVANEPKPEPSSFHLGHRPCLDGLRGVSILAVVALHAHLMQNRAAFIGVDIFFVLSGFLITSLLLEEWDRFHSLSLSKFYLRRALRLLPALLVVLVTFTGYQWILGPTEAAKATTREALAALFYAQNWILAFSPLFNPGLFGHTWSLSIEEQFYLIWPPILLFALRRTSSRASLARWVVLGVGLSAVARVLLVASGSSLQRIHFGTDTRCDALLFGCAAAAILSSGRISSGPRSVRYGSWLAYGGVGGLVLLNFNLWFGSELEAQVIYFLVPLFATLVLVDAIRSEKGWICQVLSHPWLVYVGKVSYGLYLWHLPVFLLVQARQWSFPKELGVELALTAGAVLISYYWIERPILRLKEQFVQRQAGGVGSISQAGAAEPPCGPAPD